MTLYETIFKRRSVRKYDRMPLDEKTLDDIRTFITNTRQLPGQNARFEIMSADKVKGASAPHYIMSFCPSGNAAYANVGYVLGKADLYIQSLGLGSLWLGMGNPKEKEKDFCIMLAFGKSDVPFRANAQEFNRLSISEISNSDNSIVQAARLAPSACNSQPWKLFFENGRIAVRYFGRGLTQMLLKAKMSKIDMGIITRHLVTALENEGKEVKSITPKTSGKDFEIEMIYE